MPNNHGTINEILAQVYKINLEIYIIILKIFKVLEYGIECWMGLGFEKTTPCIFVETRKWWEKFLLKIGAQNWIVGFHHIFVESDGFYFPEKFEWFPPFKFTEFQDSFKIPYIYWRIKLDFWLSIFLCNKIRSYLHFLPKVWLTILAWQAVCDQFNNGLVVVFDKFFRTSLATSCERDQKWENRRGWCV